jgi:hypothetical protein
MRSPVDDAWYQSLFRHRGGARLAGEATPEYAILGEDGFRHIKRLAPDAKALFLMRNPIEQAWSQFLHFEHKHDARSAGSGSENAKRFWESAYSAPFRDYGRTIDDLTAVFGADRSKFLFHEDVHADRQAAMRSLCDFLGADYEPRYFNDLDDRRNVSRDTPIPPDLRGYLVERHRQVALDVRDRLGTVPQSWRDDLLGPAA